MVQSASSRLHAGQPPQSLLERLAEETEEEPPSEESASAMAERFAPEAARTGDRLGRMALDPTAIPAMRMAARSSFATSQGFILVLTAVALVPAALLVALLWFGGTPPPNVAPQKATHAVQKVQKSQVSLSQQASVATAPTTGPASQPAEPAREPPKIALTTQHRIEGVAGEEVPFAISIDSAGALPPRSIIAIRDIPEGASFSHGRPYGATEWNLRPDEVGDLRLKLPKGSLRRGSMRVELVTADGKVLERAVTTLAPGPDPKEALIVRAEERDRIADLMAHGKKMIDVGYVAGARAYYKRAAEAGSADAALAVGATYDPVFIDAIGAHGTPSDLAAAKSWYDRAKVLGIENPDEKLKLLKEQWTTQETPAHNSETASREPAPTPAAAAKRSQSSSGEEASPFGRLAAAMSLGTSSEWVEVSDNVNMRPGPSADGKSKGVVRKGKKFRATGKEGNWVQVTDPVTSEVGWIFNRFLTRADPPAQ